MPTADVCRRHGVSSATFYKWEAKYGGLEVSEAKRLRQLEDENGKLKRLLVDAMLNNAMLKEIAGESGDARYQARSGGPPRADVRGESAAGVRCAGRGTDDGAVSQSAT